MSKEKKATRGYANPAVEQFLATRAAPGQQSQPLQQPETVVFDAASQSTAKANPFKRDLFGDVFGTHTDSLLGTMYRSRVQESIYVKKQGATGLAMGEEKLDGEDARLRKEGSLDSLSMVEEEEEGEPEAMEGMNSRQQLATTIRNWSLMPENDEYIIREGAVHALIALSGMDDAHIKKCCATALFHLSERPANRVALLKLGAPSGIITIAMQVYNTQTHTHTHRHTYTYISKACPLAKETHTQSHTRNTIAL